jgi:hypothetical protein
MTRNTRDELILILLILGITVVDGVGAYFFAGWVL